MQGPVALPVVSQFAGVFSVELGDSVQRVPRIHVAKSPANPPGSCMYTLRLSPSHIQRLSNEDSFPVQTTKYICHFRSNKCLVLENIFIRRTVCGCDDLDPGDMSNAPDSLNLGMTVSGIQAKPSQRPNYHSSVAFSCR